MRRLKIFSILLIALGCFHNARAFSLLGPFEAWQVERIGYQQDDDIGGPMNIGEEYRWNIPNIYYAFDESFLNYFGSNGVVAVEQAIAIVNRVPPVSTLSSNLTEYPLDVERINLRAATLSLLDLKSTTMHVLMEQVGLAEAQRWIFALRGRFEPAPGEVNYSVIQRNFDPVTARPTSYLNGSLYTYDVGEVSVNPDVADAVERLVDPTASSFSSVASAIPFDGAYYTDLSRDDVGGLRYLYHARNVNVEELAPGVEVGDTNLLSPQIISSLDYVALLQAAATNSLAQLQVLYPGITATSTNYSFSNVVQQNITTYITNSPTPGTFVLVTNFTTNAVVVTNYTFGNILANIFPEGFITEQFVNVVLNTNITPGVGNFETNVTVLRNYTSNFVNGDFILIPTNFTGFQIAATQFVTVVPVTNVVTASAAGTNVLVPFTNTTSPQILVSSNYAIFLATAATSSPAQLQLLYPGLQITGTNIGFTSGFITNITSYFTNFPTAATLVFVTNLTPTVVITTNYLFGNIVANVYDQGYMTIQRVEVIPNPNFVPGGPLFITNVFPLTDPSPIVTNFLNGDFYVVPTNLLGYQFITAVTNVTAYTNAVPFFSGGGLITFTNQSIGQLLQTIDLGLFLSQVATSPPAILQALYPDLIITSTSQIPVLALQTNFIFYFTNAPYLPAGSPPVLVTAPVVTNIITTEFRYTFANIVTNTYAETSTLVTRLVRLTPDPYTPIDFTNFLFLTNVTSTVVRSAPVVRGDIYIFPSNVVQYIFITNQNQPFFTTDIRNAVPLQTNVVVVTNFAIIDNFGSVRETITFQTNYTYAVYAVQVLTATASTNDNRIEVITYSTNFVAGVYPIELINIGASGGGDRMEVVRYWTNRVYSVFPVTFTPSATNLSRGRRAGVDKLTFIRMNYDSLLGQAFETVTNLYFDTTYSNTVPIVRQIRRLLTDPDFIFQAEDVGVVDPAGFPFVYTRTTATNWVNNDAINGTSTLAGPGVILPPKFVSYNKILPVLVNQTPLFLDELTAIRSFAWGSFDGSTNAPIIYPEGAVSIIDLENTILRPPP